MSKETLKQIAMLGIRQTRVSEAYLLQTFGIQELQKRAGHLPNQVLNEYKAQITWNNANYCSDKALKFLGDILEGVHPDALREWIVLLGEAQQIIPPEYLPALLELGDEDKPLRPYLVRIGGNALLWLAQEKSEVSWRWVKKFAQSLPDYLADAYLLERESDAWHTGELFREMTYPYSDVDAPVGRHRGVWVEVYGYRFLSANSFTWSVPLTETFMRKVYERLHLQTITSGSYYTKALWAYNFSLNIEPKRLQAWQNLVRKRLWNKYQNLSESLEQTISIIEYRKSMRQAILESA